MFGFGLLTAVNFELSETNSLELIKRNLVGSFQPFHVFLCVFSIGTATRSPYLLAVSQRVRTLYIYTSFIAEFARPSREVDLGLFFETRIWCSLREQHLR